MIHEKHEAERGNNVTMSLLLVHREEAPSESCVTRQHYDEITTGSQHINFWWALLLSVRNWEEWYSPITARTVRSWRSCCLLDGGICYSYRVTHEAKQPSLSGTDQTRTAMRQERVTGSIPKIGEEGGGGGKDVAVVGGRGAARRELIALAGFVTSSLRG